MKKIVLIYILISFCFSLSSCDLDGMKVNLYFGFQKDDYIVLDEKSERGFHGDGFSRLILDCSENTVEAHDYYHACAPAWFQTAGRRIRIAFGVYHCDS